MARRFNFGDEDTYIPTRFSPRVQRNFSFEENDERFNKPDIGTGYQPREEEETDPYDDIISKYKNVLNEEQPALSRYRQAMQNMPQRQDYDLGKWGKVGAALAGFGAGYRDPMEGVKVATTLREQPYRRALADYEMNLENQGQEVEFEAKDRATKMKGLDLELEGYKERVKAANQRRLDDSLIGRREKQNQIDEDKQNLSEREFILKYQDTLNDNELAAALGQSTIDFRNRQATTGEYNARTSRGQLGVAQGRLNFETGPKFNFEQDKFQNEFFQRGEEEAGRNRRDNPPNQQFITPGNQTDATNSAADEVYRVLPAYRKFYNEPEPGEKPSLRDDLTDEELNSAEFAKLKAEIKGRANSILNRTRSSGRRFEEVK